VNGDTRRWSMLLGLILCTMLVVVGTADAEKVKLEVYVRAPGIAGGTAAETEWENQMYAEFEKQHPNIKLELITPVGSAGFLEKLITL